MVNKPNTLSTFLALTEPCLWAGLSVFDNLALLGVLSAVSNSSVIFLFEAALETNPKRDVCLDMYQQEYFHRFPLNEPMTRFKISSLVIR